MNKIIVLNHKMGLLYSDIYDYIEGLNKIETKENIIVAPSYLYLTEFVNSCNWGIASQNVYHKLDENYTAEVSTLQLKDIGIEYCLVGHYDRVKLSSENLQEVNLKVKALLDSNIVPILCFGEENTDEDLFDIINRLKELLKDIDNIDFILFAYEPSYMIDSDEVVDVDRVSKMISDIKDYLHTTYHSKVNILYGGNVNCDNISLLLNDKNIDGVVVGSLSSNINKVNKMFEIIDREVQ